MSPEAIERIEQEIKARINSVIHAAGRIAKEVTPNHPDLTGLAGRLLFDMTTALALRVTVDELK